MKDVELRLIAELMKDGRRSDRELAKVIGISQPTVTRIRTKLEKSGAIKEYTIIPDFAQLGYTLMGATSLEVTEALSKEKFQKVRKATINIERTAPHAALLAINGVGTKKNRLFISFYENYSEYTNAMRLTRQIPLINTNNAETILADLNDETNYRVLSMSAIANHLLQRLEKRNKNESIRKAKE
jgi:DNA-binding Lrp family transcriptional regulator